MSKRDALGSVLVANQGAGWHVPVAILNWVRVPTSFVRELHVPALTSPWPSPLADLTPVLLVAARAEAASAADEVV